MSELQIRINALIEAYRETGRLAFLAKVRKLQKTVRR